MKKILNIRLAVLGLLLALTAATIGPMFAASTGFTDVPTSHWAYSQINEAVQGGITTGYSDGTFRPSNSVTFGAFSLMLARAFYADELAAQPNSTTVNAGVAVARNHKLFTDTLMDTTDMTGSAIPRQDMARMMFQLIADHGMDIKVSHETFQNAKSTFSDYSSALIYTTYATPVVKCWSLGLLNGLSDGSFGGTRPMNRAQACVVISRLKACIQENGGVAGTPVTYPSNEEVSDISAPTGSGSTPVNTNGSNDAVLTNGKPVTEANVQALIDELIATKYPDDYTYDAYDPYYFKGRPGRYGLECAKFAYMFSDDIFGSLPARANGGIENARPGDVLEGKNSEGKTFHWEVVVSSFDSDGWLQARGGGSSGTIGPDWIEPGTGSNIIVWTRYPR